MFLFVLGSIVGFFAAMVVLSSILITGVTFDMAVWTNIIIAIGTAVAAFIHYDSVKKQRKDRIWEINKDVLLELLDLVSQAIEETEFSLNPEYAHEVKHQPNTKVWDKLKSQTNLALNVYGPLMSKELVGHIETSKKLDEQIHDEVFFADLDHQDAYERSLENRQALQLQLKKFISEMSGVHT
ncbi:TPA: hypothetical protein NG611_004606 [Vibrio parahaemolyticus]|uniref:hypothetical protein n=1 Tax=Vibrio parahaemolyticus TaxID=670 RepID=UPI0003F9D356|nr:hypothetical protein [Vibrio parahaemolyticus]EKA5638215.1 hypothetical protein [Vibrio navarrensis]KJR16757.1 hypothetical protein UF29_19805 [Vibrio parahaemolyticus]MBE5196223.1 hypothetical protein [Vibrio parahaemolyticus]MDF4395701.1 hypothetical protein [Vibrio parahaemolyticus]HCE1960073.1 hypothetical protein [Vibrio parahaemolyticus]